MTKSKKVETELGLNLSELLSLIHEFGIVDGVFESDDESSYVTVEDGEYKIVGQVTSKTRFLFRYYDIDIGVLDDLDE